MTLVGYRCGVLGTAGVNSCGCRQFQAFETVALRNRRTTRGVFRRLGRLTGFLGRRLQVSDHLANGLRENKSNQ